jgi:membrane protease YdiL (CAAX protease family)
MAWFVGMFLEFPIIIVGTQNNVFKVIFGLLIYLLEIFGLYQLYRWLAKEQNEGQQRPIKPLWQPWVKQTYIVMGSCLLLALAATALYNHVETWMNLPTTHNGQVVDQYLQTKSILFFSSMILFGPICEELLYRACFFSFVIFKQYVKRSWIITAIIINGIFFGLLHSGLNLIPLIYYALIGMILASSYVLTGGDVKASALVHILGNTTIALLF